MRYIRPHLTFDIFDASTMYNRSYRVAWTTVTHCTQCFSKLILIANTDFLNIFRIFYARRFVVLTLPQFLPYQQSLKCGWAVMDGVKALI